MTERSAWGREATQLQGVDTLLALPQWYLNVRLDDLLTGDKSLREVQLRMKPKAQAWLTGVVSQLAVRTVVTGSTSSVVFTVAFAKGTMDYYELDDSPPTLQRCDISGLQVGFLVDLAKAGVHPDGYKQLPGDVRDRIATLPPGSFTIQQLLLDLENANLAQYDDKHTMFPKSMPPSATGIFPTYLTTYIKNVRNAGGHILGYTVTVPDWTDPVASFPPSSLDFATNSYRDDSKEDNTDLDTIQYLMMTGKAALPKNLKPWWGNFVVPSDGVGNTRYGTIAMAKGLFFDKYLTSKLNGLICAQWTLGDNGDSLDLNATPATGSLTPTATGASWQSPPQTGKSHKTNTFSNDDVTYTFQWSASLAFTPGGEKVRITRTVDFDIAYTHWYGVEDHAVSSTFRVSYRVPLILTMTLLGAPDGKLQVSVADDSPKPDPNTLYDLPHGYYVTGSEGSASIWADVADTMERAVDKAIRAAVGEAIPQAIETTIAKTLNLSPFIFPGGAQLALVDPVFNDAGDLLFGVSHKS